MSNRFEELNRLELAARRDALVLIPVGATEQHGPHLATGTDSLIITRLIEEVVKTLSIETNVISIPCIPFGYSHHHLQFGATVSLQPETLQNVLVDTCNSLIDAGFTRLFIVNGHGGNNEIIAIAARKIALTRDVRIGASSYWIMAWEELTAAGAHESNRLPGHAGSFETSIIKYLRPDLVRSPIPQREGDFSTNAKSFYGAFMTEDPQNWKKIDGYSDSPSGADDSKGELWFQATLKGVTRALREFLSGAR